VTDDGELVARLRNGDEAAFVELIDRYNGSLLRFARTMVPNDAVAEEAVQDTWLGVVRGVAGFEGRSSLKTWLFRIVANRARTAGVRERKAGTPLGFDSSTPSVAAGRFDEGGAWSDPPGAWATEVEQVDDRMEAERLRPVVGGYLDDLPEGQRQVVTLRDVEGLAPDTVCELLGITDANQRVLLHRGRTRLRSALATSMGKD